MSRPNYDLMQNCFKAKALLMLKSNTSGYPASAEFEREKISAKTLIGITDNEDSYWMSLPASALPGS